MDEYDETSRRAHRLEGRIDVLTETWKALVENGEKDQAYEAGLEIIDLRQELADAISDLRAIDSGNPGLVQ